ncbi:MAG: cytidylyltransferase domain-containing protein [Thermoleophilia bacterium]
MTPRVVAIAQARMGSTRLPGKVMLDLAGRPVVDRVVERLSQAATLDAVVVAVPDLSEDDRLADHLRAQGVTVVRGSSDDVLARYAKAAGEANAEVIVRVTCDCPLIDPQVIDETVAAFFWEPPVDYCSNTLRRTYPIGMDTEIFTRQALKSAHSEARALHEREHVTPFIYQRPERFRLRNVEAPPALRRPQYRLTVDEESDLTLAREIYNRLGGDPHLFAVIELLDENPELALINAAVSHREMERPVDWAPLDVADVASHDIEDSDQSPEVME